MGREAGSGAGKEGVLFLFPESASVIDSRRAAFFHSYPPLPPRIPGRTTTTHLYTLTSIQLYTAAFHLTSLPLHAIPQKRPQIERPRARTHGSQPVSSSPSLPSILQPVLAPTMSAPLTTILELSSDGDHHDDMNIDSSERTFPSDRSVSPAPTLQSLTGSIFDNLFDQKHGRKVNSTCVTYSMAADDEEVAVSPSLSH